VDQLGAIIASLPQPKPAATSRAATPTAAAPQPTTTVDTPAAIPTTWTEVVDLSFADAGELVANLQPLLAGSTMGGTVNIAAHASANQVIVSGLYDDMAAILAVIEKLDRTPRQVYVDAIIAEVSEDTASRLGLQFSINSDNLAASFVTGVTGINIGSAAGDPFLAGAAGGVIAAGRGANAIPDIGVMLAALQGDTDNRILATPSLMTTENKESTISAIRIALRQSRLTYVLQEMSNSSSSTRWQDHSVAAMRMHHRTWVSLSKAVTISCMSLVQQFSLCITWARTTLLARAVTAPSLAHWTRV